MGKTAFVFPGQGSQYTGMGKDFYERYPVCRAVFDRASEAVGFDLAALCFEKNDKLNVTEYTQIAMLTVEAAILAALREAGITADVTAGLSLGEYGALLVSGALREEDAFRLIRKRGIYMQEAVPEGGAMAAVIGLGNEAIERICGETKGFVSVANYNCPGQTVISGTQQAVEDAGLSMKKAGARRVLPLKVSGPFHSELLKGAGEKLGLALKEVQLQNIHTPYVTNVTADYVTDSCQVKELLIQQVYSPVRWQQSTERMLADGVNTFLELGPGKTLTGFLKKIRREAVGYSVETAEDFEKIREIFGK